jgi:TerC family integral membrane protein
VIAIGIVGALALRGVAICRGPCTHRGGRGVVFVFGGLLLYVAYRALRGRTETTDPSDNRVLRLVRRLIPTTDEFRGRRLFVREGGRLSGTPLLLVIIAIVVADIAFAIDSVPAALAVTRDAGVIWTANAFALVGPGAFLALVDLLVRRFRYLDETIALVLGFVGLKILLADVVPIGDVASLAVIALLLAGGIAGSLLADRLAPPESNQTAASLPARTCAVGRRAESNANRPFRRRLAESNQDAWSQTYEYPSAAMFRTSASVYVHGSITASAPASGGF